MISVALARWIAISLIAFGLYLLLDGGKVR
jgi:hypothetical protein